MIAEKKQYFCLIYPGNFQIDFAILAADSLERVLEEFKKVPAVYVYELERFYSASDFSPIVNAVMNSHNMIEYCVENFIPVYKKTNVLGG
jgi:hypothetical protein